ncbi:aryl-alcohol dehydrogenase-like predicted oxidoreductase [Streptomyces sp. V3I8]|nr:aryl-alcohol dehydrogenase-like predicted oxidoreductase [Streptomyces sp. V3I8]
MVRAGKARYLGASGMYAWQFAKMQHTAELHGWTRFVSMQDQYHLVQRGEEQEMFPLPADQNFDGRPLWQDSDKPTIDAVERIANDRGVSMATIALARVLKRPVVDAPIVGATKEHHLPAAAAALGVTLTDDETKALEEHYVPREPTYF